jgi:hypothetical protein
MAQRGSNPCFGDVVIVSGNFTVARPEYSVRQAGAIFFFRNF